MGSPITRKTRCQQCLDKVDLLLSGSDCRERGTTRPLTLHHCLIDFGTSRQFADTGPPRVLPGMPFRGM